MFSARGAGILGFSIFGRDLCYVLDEKLNIDVEKVNDFLMRHEGETILGFGFTYLIWSAFCEACRANQLFFNMENMILIHGGGFKKLTNLGITDAQFKQALYETGHIKRIHNYYGMAEQTGSIYMECECGHLHASSYSDILIRNKKDLSVCDIGECGLIQVISPAAQSYPGHSILTEDEGILLGEDDCSCGRMGKYFKVLGRIPSAEIRGCSDTLESDMCRIKTQNMQVVSFDAEIAKENCSKENPTVWSTMEKDSKKCPYSLHFQTKSFVSFQMFLRKF